MGWMVLFDSDFEAWLESQEEGLQNEIAAHITLLEEYGPLLPRPYADTVKGSKYGNMKELRIQYKKDPWRILFIFDPIRQAILLVGGNKRGNRNWYRKNILLAEQRYEQHLAELEKNDGGKNL